MKQKLKEYIPALAALMVFLFGCLNVFSALFAISIGRLSILHSFLSPEITNASRTFIIMMGFSLILISEGLRRRSRNAWFVAVVLSFISLFLHILKGLDIEEASAFAILLLFLFKSKSAFFVEGRSRDQNFYILKRTILAFALLFLYSYFGFYAFQGKFNREITLKNIAADYEYSIFGIGHDPLIPLTKRARWFDNSISVLGFFTISIAFISLFSPLFDLVRATKEEKDKVRELVLKHGVNSLSYFALLDDKTYFFNSDKTAVISYKVINDVVIALGDPIGEEQKLNGIIQEFLEKMSKKGLVPVFYAISELSKNLYEKNKLRFLKIGEEAVINLGAFTTSGNKMDDVRQSVNKIKREEIFYTWFTQDQIPWAVMYDIENLHSEWISAKKLPALTFSTNFYPFPPEPKAYVLVVYSNDKELLAAFSFFPYKNNCMAMEMMLKKDKAPNGVMEASVVESINHFKNIGVGEISLGMAALSNTVSFENNKKFDHLKQFIYKNFNQYYNYEGLFKFKNKFASRWHSQYVAYQNAANLPKITFAIAHAQSRSLYSMHLLKNILKI